MQRCSAVVASLLPVLSTRHGASVTDDVAAVNDRLRGRIASKEKRYEK